MQLFVTENIASTADLPLVEEDTGLDPLFSWTVGWYQAWKNHGDGDGEDLLVAFNNAARFVVAIFPVYREDLPDVLGEFQEAIRHALEAEHCNPALIEKYLEDLGESHFTMNRSKESIARLDYSKNAIMDFFPSWLISEEVGTKSDLFGIGVNVSIESAVSLYRDVNVKRLQPAQCLGDALAAHYGLPRYQFKALAIECTLDLSRYKAIRNIVVPSNMSLDLFSALIQAVYSWDLEHSHAFNAGGDPQKGAWYSSFEYAVPEVDDDALMPEEVYTVSDLFGEGIGDHSLYECYNDGPAWKIDLHLVKRFQTYDKELPRQLSAEGQAPPMDCDGVENFNEMLDTLDHPDSPRYAEVKEKLGDWSRELPEKQKGERVVGVCMTTI